MNLQSWFKGLRGKLLVLTMAPIVLVAFLVSISLYGIKDLQENIEQGITQDTPSAILLGEMNAALMTMVVRLWETENIDVKNSEARAKIIKSAKGEIEGFDTAYISFQKLKMTSDEKKSFAALETAWSKVKPIVIQAIALLEAHTEEANQKAAELISGTIRSELEPADNVMTDFNASQRASLAEAEKESNILVSRVRSTLFGASFLGLLAILVMGLTVAHRLAKSLTMVISDVGNSSHNVSAGSTQLSNAGQQLSKASSNSAASIEETVAAMEEIASMVKTSAENANQAQSISQTSRGAAEKGEKQINDLIAAIGEISDYSKKVQDITSVIDELAFQTNLLALNAAVEAARAGDHGKGFAVVADAVRNLAQKSAGAAKDISQLISESAIRTEKGVSIAQQSSEVMKEIVSSIQKVASLVNEISSASTEQSKGIAQVSLAMNQMDQGIQSNASVAKEVESSSEELSSTSENLENLVDNLVQLVTGDKKSQSADFNLAAD